MSSLLILFHFQNKEKKQEETGDRERNLSSAMIRAPSVNMGGNSDGYKDVRRGFLDKITTNAIKKKSLSKELTDVENFMDEEKESEALIYEHPLDSDEEQLDEWEMLYQK